MQGYCENCKRKNVCNKVMGMLSGFCVTDYEPGEKKYRYEVHTLVIPFGEVLTVDSFETAQEAIKAYYKLPPELFKDLVKTDNDGNYLETLESNY